LELNDILKFGVKIKHKSLDDCLKISRNNIELSFELLWMYQCVDKNRDIYYFYKTFDSRATLDSNYFKVQNYLRDLLKLMRLFKEGNIQMPINFNYVKENNRPTLFSTLTIHDITILSNNYSLETSKIDDLQNFLNDFDLSINEKSLNLALENYELSYEVKNVNLQFLTLMNALEVLLKSGNAELKYRLSRNGAVLLGKDKGESEKIYKELRCLYDIRSSIVHTGEPKECEKSSEKRKTLNSDQMVENISILRKHVRDSIKEMNFVIKKDKKNKTEILKMLNKCGFGERSWRFKDR
jgi:hypothetical protein